MPPTCIIVMALYPHYTCVQIHLNVAISTFVKRKYNDNYRVNTEKYR